MTEQMPADIHQDSQCSRNASECADPNVAHGAAVALLTGGGDKPYAYGLTKSLAARGAVLDLIGSDELDFAEFRENSNIKLLNLRGDLRSDVPWTKKMIRILRYYAKLIRYAATATPNVFHILWNNKFELIDRTLMMLYYKALGKAIVFTVHNVNACRRDRNDSRLNRLTLRIQYRLSDHLFVHTEKCRSELIEEFGVDAARISIIPFGINNSVPNTELTSAEAKRRLGIERHEKTILFFGRITPYKGVDILVDAYRQLAARGDRYRIVIAGRPHQCEEYWKPIEQALAPAVRSGQVLLKAEHIPDEETELYFKAADVLVLPYKHIYQSGVLFLGYGFGLPVIAADVGSLREEVVEGETGFMFRSEDPTDLARTIERYFESDLHAHLDQRRREIHDAAMRRHSWDLVSQITVGVYARLNSPPSASRCDGCSV
jgi:D-inositol-3-phosphate glycosyltransferase